MLKLDTVLSTIAYIALRPRLLAYAALHSRLLLESLRDSMEDG